MIHNKERANIHLKKAKLFLSQNKKLEAELEIAFAELEIREMEYHIEMSWIQEVAIKAFGNLLK